MAAITGKIVAVTEVSKFIVRCMVAAGAPEDGANVLADVLVTADYRGHFSHGLNRLGEGWILSQALPYPTLVQHAL